MENAQPKQFSLFSAAANIVTYKYILCHCGLFHYIYYIIAITVINVLFINTWKDALACSMVLVVQFEKSWLRLCGIAYFTYILVPDDVRKICALVVYCQSANNKNKTRKIYSSGNV